MLLTQIKRKPQPSPELLIKQRADKKRDYPEDVLYIKKPDKFLMLLCIS